MQKLRQIGLSALLPACLCLGATAAEQAPKTQLPAVHSPFIPKVSGQVSAASAAPTTPAAVNRVHVLNAKDSVEIEIESSGRLVPQTQMLNNPDRLVVDFPNAAPGAQLRNQPVNRGEVKDVRVGLFQTNPPVTRVVLDLKSAQSYRIFPDGKTVIIKIGGKNHDTAQGVEDFPPEPVTRPGLLTTNYTAGAERVSVAAATPVPVLDVTFRNGLLSIKSTHASLSEILFAVHQRTGAEVSVSAGAEQEKVAADIGPGPAPEVLTRLLNGSKFNYLILSSPDDPRVLAKVILSPKAEGAITPLPPVPNEDIDEPPAPPPIPQRADTQGENPPPVQNAPSTNGAPMPTASAPHGQTPPPTQQPSTPPPDESTPD